MTMALLFEVCSYLAECDLVEISDKSKSSARKSALPPLSLAKKRATFGKTVGSKFNLELRIDVSELEEALDVAEKFQASEND